MTDTFTIDACEEAFVRDFCPYKGSPDPLVVWRAAWKAALAAPAEALPEVQSWRAARREVERATEIYNAALIEARAKDEVRGFGYTSVDAEYQAMTRAGNAVISLVRPMLVALDKR